MPRPQLNPFLSLCILLALILSSCAPAPTPTPTPKPTHVPTPTPVPARFDKTNCKVDTSAMTEKVDCGILFVPEDRSQPNSPLIQLAVAIIRSPSAHPAPDPVVYLQGGPGVNALDDLAAYHDTFGGILANRDLIVFDQRGVGFSSPSLECPEEEDQLLKDLAKMGLSGEEWQQHSLQADQVCHDRLVKAGRNLSAYTSAASAADVNDLRVALGYAKWNLYGGSYGSRLALTIMRDYPQGLRSVVLDSVWPPQVDLDAETAGNTERALNLLFERCAADVECNAAYPDLKTVFYDAVAKFDARPAATSLIRPRTGKFVLAYMDGDAMIGLVSSMLRSTDTLPYIPKMIYILRGGGSDRLLVQYWSNHVFGGDYGSAGMQLSVECAEEAIFTSPQAIATANATVSSRLQDAFGQGFSATCPVWKVKPAAALENQPVVSNIPTLILTGDDDPATPPAWGKLAAQTLSNSYYFEFTWAAHGVIYGSGPAASCSQGMMNAFVSDPTSAPDSACMKDLKVSFVTK